MRKIILMLLLAVVSSGATTTAYAAFTYQNYPTYKNSSEFKLFLFGVGSGYLIANSFLDINGQKKLYCQPGKLALGYENYADILNQEIDREIAEKRSPIIPETPLELLLLAGLQKTFPCK